MTDRERDRAREEREGGWSHLITHVLYYPPLLPPRAQLCPGSFRIKHTRGGGAEH